jgi:hypothetical protein
MDLTGDLSFRFPLMRGFDVRAVQQALGRAKLLQGPADGIYGPATAAAVRSFQRQNRLKEDGIVGRNTWSLLFSDQAAAPPSLEPAAAPLPERAIVSVPWSDVLQPYVARLTQEHGAPVGNGSRRWRLQGDGVAVDGRVPRTGGAPKTAGDTWRNYRAAFERCAAAYGVPVELLVAIACTESGGRADLVREEPGYVDDLSTPNRVSPGLMQTLISTARSATNDPSLDRAALLVPDASVRAAACYVKQQAVRTRLGTNFDPPLVAIAYNAGSLRAAGDNPWGLVQTLRDARQQIFHADAYVEYFNDCFAVLAAEPAAEPGSNTPSFWRLLNAP